MGGVICSKCSNNDEEEKESRGKKSIDDNNIYPISMILDPEEHIKNEEPITKTIKLTSNSKSINIKENIDKIAKTDKIENKDKDKNENNNIAYSKSTKIQRILVEFVCNLFIIYIMYKYYLFIFRLRQEQIIKFINQSSKI